MFDLKVLSVELRKDVLKKNNFIVLNFWEGPHARIVIIKTFDNEIL